MGPMGPAIFMLGEQGEDGEMGPPGPPGSGSSGVSVQSQGTALGTADTINFNGGLRAEVNGGTVTVNVLGKALAIARGWAVP